MNRRNVLSLVGSAAAVSISGCLASQEGGNGQTEDQTGGESEDRNEDETDYRYSGYDEPGLVDVETDTGDIDFENISDDLESVIQTHSEAVSQVGATISMDRYFPKSTLKVSAITDVENKTSLGERDFEGGDTRFIISDYGTEQEGYSRIKKADAPPEFLYRPGDSKFELSTGDKHIMGGFQFAELELIQSGSTGSIEVFEYAVSTTEDPGEGICVISEQGAVLELSIEYENRTTELTVSDFGKTTVEEPSWVSDVDEEADRGDHGDWVRKHT